MKAANGAVRQSAALPDLLRSMCDMLAASRQRIGDAGPRMAQSDSAIARTQVTLAKTAAIIAKTKDRHFTNSSSSAKKTGNRVASALRRLSCTPSIGHACPGSS